jgi:hypothetical protein
MFKTKGAAVLSALAGLIILSSFTLGMLSGESNYILKINGEDIAIDLDKEVNYTLSSGEKLNITLSQPDELVYTDHMLTFKYSKEFGISRTKVDEGIDQLGLMTSRGNGFFIQEYETITPTFFTAMMINEITKESVNYGYEKVERPFSKKLSNGKELNGVEATLTYNGDVEVYTVSTYGAKDKGVIVITMMIDPFYKDLDQPIMDLLYKSLEIKD